MENDELQKVTAFNETVDVGAAVDVTDDDGNVFAAVIDRPAEFTGVSAVVWIVDENHPHPYLYLLDRVTVRA